MKHHAIMNMLPPGHYISNDPADQVCKPFASTNLICGAPPPPPPPPTLPPMGMQAWGAPLVLMPAPPERGGGGGGGRGLCVCVWVCV